MDYSVRNGIVLENILPFIEDVQTTMKLSAVCKNWYEQINNNIILWNRLKQNEHIQYPQHFDWLDDEDQWTLGIPCEPKKILINYRRTNFCFKNNIYKKYDFTCCPGHLEDMYNQYDGKTFVLLEEQQQVYVYKIINNNFQLFQKLKVNNINLKTDIITYTKYIIFITESSGKTDVITYKLYNLQYVPYNQCSFEIKFDFYHLFSDIFIVGCKNKVFAWNIPENRILFNGINESNTSDFNYLFLKQHNSLFYFALEKMTSVYDYVDEYFEDFKESKVVAYNDKFQLVNEIKLHNCEVLDELVELAITEHWLIVIYIDFMHRNEIRATVWDKTTKQCIIGPKFEYNEEKLEVSIISVEGKFILAYAYIFSLRLIAYNDKTLEILWQVTLSTSCKTRVLCHLNKLLIERRNLSECLIEYRDTDTGNILYTVQHTNCTSHQVFANMILSRNVEGNVSAQLYR